MVKKNVTGNIFKKHILTFWTIKNEATMIKFKNIMGIEQSTSKGKSFDKTTP